MADAATPSIAPDAAVSSSDQASPPAALTIAMLCWITRGTFARVQARTQLGVPSRRRRSFAAKSPRPLGPGSDDADLRAAGARHPSRIGAPHERADPMSLGDQPRDEMSRKDAVRAEDRQRLSTHLTMVTAHHGSATGSN
jgi:hypothetical protein